MTFDPLESPDPVVQSLGRQYHDAVAKMESLARYIIVYAESHEAAVTPTPSMSISAEEHYGFDESADCGCGICMDWTTRRAEFVSVIGLIPKGHKWTVCGCDTCRFVGRFQMNHLAATNRRDLMIEMSFHARYHSLHGEQIMAWFDQEIRKPSYTDNWCAQEMSRYPVERWLMRCEMAVSGSVGGPVFQASARRMEYVEHSSSSLNADVNIMVID